MEISGWGRDPIIQTRPLYVQSQAQFSSLLGQERASGIIARALVAAMAIPHWQLND